MRRALLLAVLLLTVAAPGLAETYTVDSAGGPLTLSEETEAAFAAWLDAGAPSVPEEEAGSSTEFAWGDEDLFGPDTFSLTVQRSGSGPEPDLQILLNAEEPDLLRAALLHEAGLVLGLTPAAEGALNPALTAAAPATVSEADVEQLLSRAGAITGDLNADGSVDFADLLELAAAFGDRGFNLPADLDGDGEVTAEDARIMREHYEFRTPEEPAETDSADGSADTGQQEDSGADAEKEEEETEEEQDDGQTEEPDDDENRGTTGEDAD